MPLTVGGGVRTVDDIRQLLLAGADKVSINTEAVRRPDFVREAAEKFGSQCIVVAIDAKQTGPGRWEVFTHGGRTATGIYAVDWARRMAELGAGGDPADLDGPGRHGQRVRHRADPHRRGRGAGAGDRVGRGRHASTTWSTASETVTPPPPWPPRSSTSAPIPSPRPRPTWQRPASPCAWKQRTTAPHDPGDRPRPPPPRSTGCTASSPIARAATRKPATPPGSTTAACPRSPRRSARRRWRP